MRDQGLALHEQTKDFHSTVNSITSSSIWDTNYLAKVFNDRYVSYVGTVFRLDILVKARNDMSSFTCIFYLLHCSTKTMMSYVDKVEEIFNTFQEQKKLRGGMPEYIVILMSNFLLNIYFL